MEAKGLEPMDVAMVTGRKWRRAVGGEEPGRGGEARVEGSTAIVREEKRCLAGKSFQATKT